MKSNTDIQLTYEHQKGIKFEILKLKRKHSAQVEWNQNSKHGLSQNYNFFLYQTPLFDLID